MSYVYFAHCGNYIKIGFSYRPEVRVKKLFDGNLLTVPPGLDRSSPRYLLRTIPDCIMKDERRLHDYFADYRAEGEFFLATPELLAEIEALQYETVREERSRLSRERRIAKAEALARAS